ncbi:MAG: glycosyltransferase [Phycisphaerae bacterium]|nr:glycosyltransferase [Phycisphaerae bacterium]
MDWLELGKDAFLAFYTTMLVLVSMYGLHRYVLVYLYYRHRRNAPKAAGEFAELPVVTIQLPMYNERAVARRIIESTCEIDYPREKMQIQVLDDSTDDTVEIASKVVQEMRQRGFDMEYIHRDNREGFKAGALTYGLATAKGEFVTIFDADFIPAPDILRRSINYFTDPRVCVVQARWDHLNRTDSLLTRTQAIFLDGHFIVEHIARNRSERFMSFNGTAGTWRKSAIDDAGGWQHDTLTEDLDLSYRAQLKGWKFVFLPELTAPAELPPEMNAFKAQQHRWTKGGAQTTLKLLPKVMFSRASLKVKVEAFFHLTGFTMHLYMCLLVLMLYPAMMLRGGGESMWRILFDLGVFAMATISANVFYIAGQLSTRGSFIEACKYMPLMMALGVGMCFSNAKAVLEAFFGQKSDFVRTPKYGDLQLAAEARPRKKKTRWVPYVEFVVGIYMTACLIWCVVMGGKALITAPFLAIFAFGFFYVSSLSFLAEKAIKHAPKPQKQTV